MLVFVYVRIVIGIIFDSENRTFAKCSNGSMEKRQTTVIINSLTYTTTTEDERRGVDVEIGSEG